jgi:hypothetical protein
LVPWWPRDFPSFSMVYRLNAQSLKSHEATRIWNESPLHNLYFETLEPFGSQTIAQNMGAWRTSLVDLRFATRICIIKMWTPWKWEGKTEPPTINDEAIDNDYTIPLLNQV